MEGAYSYWRATLGAGKWGKFNLYVQATAFAVSHVLRLTGTIPALRRLVCCLDVLGWLRFARTPHTQSSFVRFRYKPSRSLGLLDRAGELWKDRWSCHPGFLRLGNGLQIGRISWGCLDCLGFPGHHCASPSPSSANTGGKLSSGPFIRRRSKLVDILKDGRQSPRRFGVTRSRATILLRSSVFELRPSWVVSHALSLISFFQRLPSYPHPLMQSQAVRPSTTRLQVAVSLSKKFGRC